MWVDLISTNNLGHYNIKIAERFGLTTSIYLNEVIDICEKAHRKNTVDKDGFFKLYDRDYITRRTTLTRQEQSDMDDNLINAGIIKLKNKSDPDTISIDFSKLMAIMETEDVTVLKDLNKIFKSKSKYYKQESLSKYCKKAIKVANDELRKEYEDWVDAVIAKDGTLLPSTVSDAESVVNNYSRREYGNDLEIAINLVHIGAVHGYRDLRWAIPLLEKYGR